MLKEELKNLIEGEVDDSSAILEKYSHDYSIFEVKPEIVVFPKNKEDIKKIVKFVSKKRELGFNISITPRAAGTCMSGGSLNTSIILDTTKHINGVIDIKRGDFGKRKSFSGKEYEIKGLVSVLPGTFYRDMEKKTLEYGLIMPCYPASKELCAVGGMVANNGAGEKTLKYGQNKDLVESLKVILYDGEEYEIKQLTREELEAQILENNTLSDVYRKVWNLIKRNFEEIKNAKPKTSKNSSGYLLWDVWDPVNEIFDPIKLFVSAQGTTGIITEITYRLVEVEKNSTLLVVFVKNLEEIPQITHELLKNDVETLELYDDHTIKFAVRFFFDFVKNKGLLGTIKYALRFLPEFFMILSSGVPKVIVLAEFVSNNKDEILREARVAQSKLSGFRVKTRITKDDEEREKYFSIRRDSFKLLSDHSKGKRTAPFIDDVVVPIDNLPKYLPELTKILSENNILYTVAGHLGDGNLHVIPLMDFKDPNTVNIIKNVTEKVYEIVKKYNGSITAEHNDGLIRTPYLKMMFGEKISSIFAEFKEIMDPQNIFNPKKKVGATVSDIEKYIIRKK